MMCFPETMLFAAGQRQQKQKVEKPGADRETGKRLTESPANGLCGAGEIGTRPKKRKKGEKSCCWCIIFLDIAMKLR